MHHPTDRIVHTTVVEQWLEREIAQWVHPMKDRSDDPSHYERTLLPRSYITILDILADGWLEAMVISLLPSPSEVNKDGGALEQATRRCQSLERTEFYAFSQSWYIVQGKKPCLIC